jgi:hypothetical protein
MKKLKRNKWMLLPLLLLCSNGAAAQEDSVTAEETVTLKYYNQNNSMQYLITESMLKTGKKKEPQKNKTYRLYLDSIGEAGLIGKVITDASGRAKSFLPPSLKPLWDAGGAHKFVAVAEGNEAAAGELEITKARIKIDTASEEGVKRLTVTVSKYEGGSWIPAADVEMKLGIRRMGGILPAADEATYTTDSSGTVVVELKKDSMPGDARGNIMLAARVEDNDQLGNLSAEQIAPWGIPTQVRNDFFEQRTLWSTRFRTPFWLLLMAYGIVLGVWGTLIYLVFQLIKIRRLGKVAA